jgi:hypothetical protein
MPYSFFVRQNHQGIYHTMAANHGNDEMIAKASTGATISTDMIFSPCL